jgi:hypothetical protein
MRAFFAKHFAAIAAGAFINLPFLFKGAVWVTDWLARFDFWNTHGHEFAGINVVIGFLTDPPPWTVFLTSTAAVVIVLWDVRRQSQAPQTKDVAKLDLNQKLLIGFYLGCAVLCSSVWFTAWFVSLPVKATPAPTVIAPPKIATPASIAPKRKTEATTDRAIYKCQKVEVTDPKAIDASNAAFKKYIEVYADTYGFAAKVSVVPGGNKAELTPATSLGQKNMGSALKITFEVRKSARIYLVSIPQNFHPLFGRITHLSKTLILKNESVNGLRI